MTDQAQLMSDSDYYPLWQNLTSNKSPFELAVAAGRLATNPSLIFIAGYQAAIREVFPELKGPGWYSFAVSEDRTPGSTRPGVTLADGKVSGYKTWIAAVSCIDELVLKVGGGTTATYGVVDAKAVGTKLSAKPTARFLPQMSQGFAQFEEAQFTPLADASRVGQFHKLEPYFIYLAFLAHLAEHDFDVSERASELIVEQRSGQNVQQLDLEVAALLELLSNQNIELGENWDTDQRLFTMYSKGIQG